MISSFASFVRVTTLLEYGSAVPARRGKRRVRPRLRFAEG
jgi:hypothetical protein